MIELYVIKNEKGWFFKGHRYLSSDLLWVENIKDAKIFPKLKTARAAVSGYVNSFRDPKEVTIPDIIKLDVSIGETLNEKERVLKQNRQKKERMIQKEIKYKKRRYEEAQKELEYAQRRLQTAKENAQRLL